MDGFIKLHRKLLEWEWYDDDFMVKFLIHCLLKANHAPNKWRGISIKKGSFISSREKLAKQLNTTTQKIRTAEKRMIDCNELLRTSTNKHTLYTLVKWEDFQISNKQITNGQQTDNKQITTNKNGKNEKNNNNRRRAKEKPKDLQNVVVEDLQKWVDSKAEKGHHFTIDLNLELEKCKNYFETQSRTIGTVYNWLIKAQEIFNDNQRKQNGKSELSGIEFAKHAIDTGQI